MGWVRPRNHVARVSEARFAANSHRQHAIRCKTGLGTRAPDTIDRPLAHAPGAPGGIDYLDLLDATQPQEVAGRLRQADLAR
jgi:hypothetical protein